VSLDSPFSNLARERLIHPPDAIAAFVRRLGARPFHGVEKRARPRFAVALPMIVMPVDDKLQKAGEPFRTLTRDISTEGIGFVHTRAIRSPLVAIELEIPGSPDKTKMQMLVEILRCQAIHESLFDVGGRFVLRLDDPDAAPPAGDDLA